MDREKIVEIIVEELKKMGVKISSGEMSENSTKPSYKTGFFTEKKYIESYTNLTNRKKLITEYDIRQMVKQNPAIKEIVLPENSILGPLAEDLLNFLNIKVIKK